MLPDTFWIVVTEHDIDPNGFTRTLPSGPLVHESLCLTEDEAETRAKGLAGRFGWTTILRVDGTQVKNRIVRPIDQATPTMGECRPNPAKPPHWCNWCSDSTETVHFDCAYRCAICKRSKP